MIITENYSTNADGVELVRTYSDKGFMVERDGVRYTEAIDPAYLGREYTETDIPISENEDGTATVDDYERVLERFGVNNG